MASDVTVGRNVARRDGSEHLPFRADIEGMRGLAVVLVVAFHAGVAPFTGGFIGVDVFFVVSGFLITGLLLREVERNGTIRLRTFYARRARRLLPLASATLILTALVAHVVMSPLDVGPLRGDITSAAFYYANWHFAAGQLNYMNAEAATSPLLHFWSLAVEEQFYLIWPLLLVVFASSRGVLGRVTSLTARSRVAILATFTIVVSFYLSATLTTSQAALAYYGLHTRAFELAAGALLAALAHKVEHTPRLVAWAAGWVGVALIVYSAIAMSRATVFPGTAAAIPVLGTVLLLAAGVRHQVGPAKMLSTAPARYIGKRSYAWYLTHWPALILVAYATNHGSATTTWPWIIAAVVGSFALAALAHRLIEQPIRLSVHLSRAAWRSLTVGAIASMCAALVGSMAAAGGSTYVTQSAVSPMQHHTHCNLVHDLEKLETCTLGDQNTPTTVALFGDSHAAMWAAALDTYGRTHHQRTVELTKEGCDFADVTMIHPFYPNVPYSQCTTWRNAAYAYLRAHPVDTLVVVRSANTIDRIWKNGHSLSRAAAEKTYTAGFKRALTKLGPGTHHVVVIEDTPFAPYNVLRCVSEHPTPRDACDFPSNGAVHRDGDLLKAERDANDGRVEFADITPTVCPANRCPTRMPNGDAIYWDSNHLTDVYSRSIADEFSGAIATATPATSFQLP